MSCQAFKTYTFKELNDEFIGKISSNVPVNFVFELRMEILEE